MADYSSFIKQKFAEIGHEVGPGDPGFDFWVDAFNRDPNAAMNDFLRDIGTHAQNGEEGGGEEGGGGGFDAGTFPPATYLPSPTDEELFFMNRYGAGYDDWARGVVGESYDQLPEMYRSALAEAFANPDVSMFRPNEATLAPLKNLGNIVRGYYQETNPIAMSRWDTDVRPRMEEQFAGPGYYGTDRAYAVNKSLNDMTQQLALQEALGYAQAQEKGTLLDTQARMGIDAARMNYLSNNASTYANSLGSNMLNLINARTNALQGLLAAGPQYQAAVANLSRKFVEPVPNPEFVMASNLATSMLGVPAFSTAGWINQDSNPWSNVLGAAGSTLGNLLAKGLPSIGSLFTNNGSQWTPNMDTTLPEFQGTQGSNLDLTTLSNPFGQQSISYPMPSGGSWQSGFNFGNQNNPYLYQMTNTPAYQQEYDTDPSFWEGINYSEFNPAY